MKVYSLIIFIFITIRICAQEAVIIDHNCIDLSDIPTNYIDSAKKNLYIGYGHTSHGSQLISGMNAIEAYFTDGTYDWSHSAGEGQLHLFEGDGYGDGYLDHDCGYSGWDTETREYLNSYPECNVIIWSWCGQVNDVNIQEHYLTPMNQLESDYPDVTFVYMTGHLEGLGSDGSVYHANQEIRDYCNTNHKILFDFSDIEKYSPDCNMNYQVYFADDGCNYNHPNGGTANWANDWLTENPDHELAEISALCSSCAHSVSLNCVKKGVASWYLWARIAGWEPQSSGIDDNLKNEMKIFPNPLKDYISIHVKQDMYCPIIEIIDLQGRVVYSKDYDGNFKTIYLSNITLEQGLYIIKVRDDKNEFYKKIIIQSINN